MLYKNRVLYGNLISLVIFTGVLFVPTEGNVTEKVTEKYDAEQIVQINDTWAYISTGNRDQNKYLESLFVFLHKEFSSIFDADVVNRIKCTIYNDKDSVSPYIHYVSEKELKIRLHLSCTSYWCQVVFQLAHEMTHYVFCQNYDYRKYYGSKWNEEIVCEAMSMYMLKQLADKWKECDLSNYDRQRRTSYARAIYTYVADERRKGTENVLKSSQEAIDVSVFRELNRTAGSDRENHRAETNYLYDLLITLEKEQIKPIVLDMYKYLKDDCYIDYESWIKEAKYPDVIEKLSKIQPDIKL